MATRAFTKVSVSGPNTPIPVGPLILAIYRIQGGTIGDTITIPATDAGGRLVMAAIPGWGSGMAEVDLDVNGETQVVFTLTASNASTSVTTDAILLVKQ
jgi:hypothetical protein